MSSLTVKDQRESVAFDETEKWPGIIKPKVGQAKIALQLTITITHFSSDHLPQASYHSQNSYSPNRLTTDRIKSKNNKVLLFIYFSIFAVLSDLALQRDCIFSTKVDAT